jgi:hypothetical protein
LRTLLLGGPEHDSSLKTHAKIFKETAPEDKKEEPIPEEKGANPRKT